MCQLLVFCPDSQVYLHQQGVVECKWAATSMQNTKLAHFHVTLQRFTPRVPMLNVWTSETSHFRPFLHERHYLFTVPTFPTELLKRNLLGSGFPTQNSYMQFLSHAPWHPAWETEGRIVQAPIDTAIWHPGNSYFLLAIFSSSHVCLGLKKMEGLAMQLWIITTVKGTINLNWDHLHLITESSSASGQRQHRCGPRVNGHRYGSDSSLLLPCRGSEGEGKEGSVITVEKVSSWRFCSDPADLPIP